MRRLAELNKKSSSTVKKSLQLQVEIVNTIFLCYYIFKLMANFLTFDVFFGNTLHPYLIRPCTVLLCDLASSLNHPSSPVDGISCNGIVTQPKKSSCELCLADWQTCLKNLPKPGRNNLFLIYGARQKVLINSI